MKENEIIQVIFDAIDQLNEQYPEDQRLTKSVDTVLFGKSGKLDSLGLVNFIVTVEEIMEENFDLFISLAEEKAMSQKNSPFRTVGTLKEYIAGILEDRGQ